MDGLKLIRKQEEQDNRINEVTNEVATARNSIQANYPTLKARIDAIDTNINIVQNNINQAIAGLHWKPSVPSLGDIAATYPNPQEGWTVSVDDTNIVYRFDDATNQWHAISSNAIGNAVPNGQAGLMTGADKAKLDGLNANDYVKKTGDTITGQLTVNGGIVGNLTGNATSATRLQNPVNITVGGTTKPFNGNTPISFSLQEIGASDINHNHDNRYLQLTGGNLTGDVNTTNSINFTSISGGIKHKGGVILRNNDVSTVLSAINGTIFFRPQGDTTQTNQATLDTNGNFTANKFVGNLQGNATSATRLQTGRTINGVLFDGTSNINIGVNTGTTTLGGYTKPNTGGAITANDTLNQAFGKIEVNLDNKADLNHTHTSNNITGMTGYAKPNTGGAIVVGDTLNQAIGKLEYGLDRKANANHNQATNTITALTGYTKGTNTSALNANDNLNTALSKLEVGLDGKASSTHTHNYAGSNTTGGVANSANRLETARTIQLTGAVTGQANFDGSQNIQINTTLANPLQSRLVRQRNSVTVNATTNTVNIGIPAYNVNDNILNVYLSGVRLDPVVDYTNTQTQVILTGNKQFINGDVVSFEVIQLA